MGRGRVRREACMRWREQHLSCHWTLPTQHYTTKLGSTTLLLYGFCLYLSNPHFQYLLTRYTLFLAHTPHSLPFLSQSSPSNHSMSLPFLPHTHSLPFPLPSIPVFTSELKLKPSFNFTSQIKQTNKHLPFTFFPFQQPIFIHSYIYIWIVLVSRIYLIYFPQNNWQLNINIYSNKNSLLDTLQKNRILMVVKISL